MYDYDDLARTTKQKAAPITCETQRHRELKTRWFALRDLFSLTKTSTDLFMFLYAVPLGNGVKLLR